MHRNTRIYLHKIKKKKEPTKNAKKIKITLEELFSHGDTSLLHSLDRYTGVSKDGELIVIFAWTNPATNSLLSSVSFSSKLRKQVNSQICFIAGHASRGVKRPREKYDKESDL